MPGQPPSPEKPLQLTAVALDVAGSCNLACRYCAEAATQPSRQPMSAETLKSALSLLFPDGQTKPGCSIRLGSGEPLLALPLLRQLAELVQQMSGDTPESRPAVFLTTNGTLATKEVRDWLVASGWYVKVSLDGPQSVHDRWRVTSSGKGTFEQVAEAVADLTQRIPKHFSVTAVLCRGADPEEVFRTIESLGVQRIELVPVAHYDEKIIPSIKDIERYHRFLENYARRYLSGRNAGKIPSLVRFENCVRKAMGYNVQSVPCGAGRSLVGVGADGELYPCFRFIGLASYRLGHLSTGLDRSAAGAFQLGPGRPMEQRRACRRCSTAKLCGGPCFACAEMFGPGNGLPLPFHCAYTRADARSATWLVDTLRKQAPERLLNFLPGAQEAYASLI